MADDLDVDHDDLPASAPLGRLRQRVEQTRQQAHLDLRIDVDDDLAFLLRYKPVDAETLDKVQKSRDSSDSIESDSRMVARACIGIFIEQGEQVVSIDGLDDPDSASAYIDADDKIVGDPITFASPWLADEFGVTSRNAVDVVRALFPLELAINRHAVAVFQFSRESKTEVARNALGN
jgi:oligoribonuclease NrnB/cAMP/cGMP phosphodiesterase (DHH superfamily)